MAQSQSAITHSARKDPSQTLDGPRSALSFTKTSYPSRCLDFLRTHMSTAQSSQQNGTHGVSVPQAVVKLQILIVGAGLGGLATAIALARRGHRVTVFEQAPQLAEVGAGIQIPPNSAKLLQRWGVMDELRGKAVQPSGISFRRWQSGDCIGYTDLTEDFIAANGSPYYVVHRADLHNALFSQATKLDVQLRLNSRVAEYGTAAASVILADGTTFGGDLVVAADGVNSIARDFISPGPSSKPRLAKFAVYRATVDVSKMRADAELSWILDKPGLNVWIGENRHVMTYTIAAGQSFNMVLSHIDRSDPATWNQQSPEQLIQELRAEFEGWDAKLMKIIRLIDKAQKWPLRYAGPFDTWIAPSSRLVMLGDAAHAMLPYMSQGAAMAVEDGAALGEVLNQIRTSAELGVALDTFEAERKERTRSMQEASAVNSMLWHFEDGPEQRARDAAMRPEVEGRQFLASPNQWSDPLTQTWAYGYDAEEAIVEAWEKNGMGKKEMTL